MIKLKDVLKIMDASQRFTLLIWKYVYSTQISVTLVSYLLLIGKTNTI